MFNVMPAFYLIHVFAIELILPENVVRTWEFRKKKYQLNEQFAGGDKNRNEIV